MSDGGAGATVMIWINEVAAIVPRGSMVSAALLVAEVPCRRSISGEPRTALCGMGICFECRATVDGIAHRRTCQIVCTHGMKVVTQP